MAADIGSFELISGNGLASAGAAPFASSESPSPSAGPVAVASPMRVFRRRAQRRWHLPAAWARPALRSPQSASSATDTGAITVASGAPASGARGSIGAVLVSCRSVSIAAADGRGASRSESVAVSTLVRSRSQRAIRRRRRPGPSMCAQATLSLSAAACFWSLGRAPARVGRSFYRKVMALTVVLLPC